MSLVGISEKKMLGGIGVHFDDLIIQKIVHEYLYPKLPYLEELCNVAKYYKLAHFIDSYHHYDKNKGYIVEYINDRTKTCKHGTCDYFNMFREHYLDMKGCVINVRQTFRYNDFDTLEKMHQDIIQNTKNVTSLYQEESLNSIILIDSSIMIRGYKKLMTDIYDFCILRRTNFVSQREYLYVMDNMEYLLDEYLIGNNKDILDKSYDDKVNMFMKL